MYFDLVSTVNCSLVDQTAFLRVALSHQNWSSWTDFGRKLVSPDHFCCQNQSTGLILTAKTGPSLPKLVPHGRPILVKVYLPKLVPHKEVQIFVCVDGSMDIAIATLKIMDIAIATSQLSQNLPACTLVLPDLSSLY